MQINGQGVRPRPHRHPAAPGRHRDLGPSRNGDTTLPIPHVFHTHLVRFQILDRNGQVPGLLESGWKDSVMILPGQQVRLIMKFGDFTGRFLYHCHLLGHADPGMMAQMEVVR